MSATTEILWCGQAQFVPDFGMVNNGDRVQMPSYLAQHFINSGKAVTPPRQSVKPPRVKEASDD